MKKSKIIKLAKKAGFVFWDNESWAPPSRPYNDLHIDWASDYNDELIKLCELVAASAKKKAKNRSKVTEAEFFRYVRPIDPRTGDIDSQKGVCFYIHMDYVARVVHVSMSVCNGDNFNKDIAKGIARRRMTMGDVLSISLNDVIDSKLSITEYMKGVLQHYSSRIYNPAMKAAARQCAL